MIKMVYLIIASSRDTFIWRQCQLKHLEIFKILAETPVSLSL